MSTSDPYRPPSSPPQAVPGWQDSGYGPPPAPGEWGAPQPQGRGPEQTETKAVVALLLAGASFVLLPFLPAVAALLVGRAARRDIDASGGRLGGSGLVTAARVVAWVNIVLSVLGVLALVLLVAAFGVVSTGSTETFVDSVVVGS